jgi:hypothetical protein
MASFKEVQLNRRRLKAADQWRVRFTDDRRSILDRPL